MRIVAVDDERLALNNITKVIRNVIADAEIIGFTKSEEALHFFQKDCADIAILDIEMPGMRGLELAKHIKTLCPNANIIFATGYSEYALQAHKLRVSGYLLKPVTEDDLRVEINSLRSPIPIHSGGLFVQTFGNFEVFYDAKPMHFLRAKSKECFAYLIDRKGAGVTSRELSAILWEQQCDSESLQSSTRKIISDMIKSLNSVGAGDIITKSRNSICVDVNQVECDYYLAIRGDVRFINSYNGEYMSNYSWAEVTSVHLDVNRLERGSHFKSDKKL